MNLACQVEYLEDRTLLTAAFSEFVDPNASADNGFGETVVTLSTGNVVITSPYDDAGGADAGAVYLYDGATGALISTLVGSSDNDNIGIDGVTALSNGNYVVISSAWNNGAATDAGAVTFGDGTTGVSGVVSAANSLVGSNSDDRVGLRTIYDYDHGGIVGVSGVTELSNGNYVVSSFYWDNGAATDAGAVTFGDGTTGVSGVVSAANSLVGSTSGDRVGGDAFLSSDVIALSNGNYVVSSSAWDNGSVVDAGAVTFGDGTTGITGLVSASNSLVGSTDYDSVGKNVTALSNGNYVVSSGRWDNDTVTDAGAVTLGDGTDGVIGVVSEANSLVGSSDYDSVSNVIALSNGNYVVVSSWSNGMVTGAGAVTFGDGTNGITGVVSETNSLVGSSSGDNVGTRVTVLPNGNYVVISPKWDKGIVTDAGAVTFGDGTNGVIGVISEANSLVGSSDYDQVGGDGYNTYDVTVLSNGNYVVTSTLWDNGATTDAGAVTFGDGATGVSGVVSSANSLVGGSSGDSVGLNGVTALSNGNYVVRSAYWDNGTTTDAGAVTLGNGTNGVSGEVSETNSLVGSTSGDNVGSNRVASLSNGNYVVISSYWDNGAVIDAGAVTFGDGTTGVSGVVSVANSLVGSTDYDQLGLYSDVIVLTNGNYVVSSYYWDNGAVTDAGAVTFGNGTTGVSGVVSVANSLVGSSDYDQVGGYGDVTVLTNGNYVVRSSAWDNGMATDAGAVTFGDGTTGVSGVVSEINSLVGSSSGDKVGYSKYYTYSIGFHGIPAVTALPNGNYVVSSPDWDNGTVTDAGAVTFGDGTTGVSGRLTSNNSVTGLWDSGISALLPGGIVRDDINNTFIINFLDKGKVWVVSQSDGLPSITLDEISDVIVNENGSEETINLTGITASGLGAKPLRVTATSSNTGLIPNPVVSYTSADATGSLAFTPVENQTGIVTITVIVEDGGLDGDLNTAGDNSTIQRTFEVAVTTLIDITKFIDPNPSADNGFGDTVAVLSTGNIVITAPRDDAGGFDAGAVYLFNGATGELISTLIGSSDNDNVGLGGVTVLSNGNYVVRSAYWDSGTITEAGAVTFGDGTIGVSGEVSSTNSLVGSKDYDYVGFDGVTALVNGNYVVSSSLWKNGTVTNAGAVTFGNGTNGVSGEVSSTNSLVGSKDYDYVGVDGVTALVNGNYVVSSSQWKNGTVTKAGAVTFGNGTNGVSGEVSSTNSLVGSSDYDCVGYNGVTALTNGNYVVSSSLWKNGDTYSVGAVTFGNGTNGVSGEVSSTNSLVGSSDGDNVGFDGVTALTNGNYVVSSSQWKNGDTYSVGAVTFGNGTNGVSGEVSSTNSLVGSSDYDNVGFDGVTALANGNYVVSSSQWNNGDIFRAGAVTFGNGTNGVSGEVSSTNSLVGSKNYDYVGNDGVVALTNGNYVVSSSQWDNNNITDAGAVTFGNGSTGVAGVVSAFNSLVGSSNFDYLGDSDYGFFAVTALTNGNYVVASSGWRNGEAAYAGAVTFGDGTNGVTGTISSTNSLVGSSEYDSVGSNGVTVLSNGNYVVSSPQWSIGTKYTAGAVTFGNGTNGVSGVISATNSLVGGSSGDSVGANGVTALTNGNYVVSSAYWDNGTATEAGAVTLGNGTTGISGEVSETNSLVGSSEYDYLGYIDYETSAVTALSNGNYVVRSPFWDNDTEYDAGAVTFGEGQTGVRGLITSVNSLIGFPGAFNIPDIVRDDVNNTFFTIFENTGNVRGFSQGAESHAISLDAIKHVVINENASEQVVNLTGIYASGSEANSLRVTATSNDTGLIPDPVVSYTSPDATGSLTFTPVANQTGIATITVTVEDGGLDGDLTKTEDNRKIQRTFDVTVHALPVEDPTLIPASFSEFVDPNASADNGFGDTIVTLSTGNVVITAPYDDAGGTDAGAVYLFNGATGELISTLTGSSDYDYVGIDGVTVLANGNFVVSSSEWKNGTATEAGAVTFGDGTIGVTGVVSETNSLVGSTTDDYVGFNDFGISAVTALSNGNYLVTSAYWDNGVMVDAGAVTFGDGTTGVSGVISETNSLVGASNYDYVGIDGLTVLANGNYVVISSEWNNGAATEAGAVTFGDGSIGVTGVVSETNSLVGSTTDDYVGFNDLGVSAVTALSNGNYLVTSAYWDNGVMVDAGAVTFGDGTTGVSGVISGTNSLIGASNYDYVGLDGVTVLANGNYVVSSSEWNNGAATEAGAVTFGDGSMGVTGVVSETNSLVGSSDHDSVGIDGVTILSNGSYVVSSSEWNNGAATEAGAVTFGDGTMGVKGVISAANSLIGSTSGDRVGLRIIYDNQVGDFVRVSGVTELSNGNYVVSSPDWDNGSVIDAGAATFGDGTSGVIGLVSAANSLVGSSNFDNVGYSDDGASGVTALTNGNYVVNSSGWDNGSVTDAGAVTLGNGTSGVKGVISAANSLVGTSFQDHVGIDGVTALANGNYVVVSSGWDNDWLLDAGAVTFGNGTNGVIGEVSETNSLVGSTFFDQVGSDGVTALSNGNYVVSSSEWTNGVISDAGAVTFGDGTNGVSGVVSATNSLVGELSDDKVGSSDFGTTAVKALSNGNYVVTTFYWDNGTATDAGAVTFGDGDSGVTGVISAANSLVGATAYDNVGFNGVTELTNGNYVVASSYWDNGTEYDAGAVTFGDGTTGVIGVVSETNSLVGSNQYDNVGIDGLTALSNGNYVITSPFWDNGAVSDAGAVTIGNGDNGGNGRLTFNNSVAGVSGPSMIRDIVQDEVNNTFFAVFANEGKVWVFSQSTELPLLTLDPLDDLAIYENAAEQTVSLTGISAGDDEDLILRVTATSNNTGLIADPVVTYTSADATGSLAFTPVANQTGIATITVTVEDGGSDGNLDTTWDNSMIQRTFDVTVTTLANIDLRVVGSPTVVGSNGEITSLPTNQEWINEWSTYWVEIWVNTDSTSSEGIFSVNLDLNYQTQFTSATTIEYGAGFALNQTRTVNDSAGVVENLYAETNASDLGISEYLLFARIKFESLSDDGVDIDTLNQTIGPYDLGFSVSESQVAVVSDNQVSTNVNPFDGASIWANPYDLNDDDVISFRDLLRFASVYGTTPSESSSKYSWFADLNQNDRVGFRDLIYFATNYGKQKADHPTINYPRNFPDAWNNPLLVDAAAEPQPQAQSVTQAAAETVLDSVVEQLSPQLTPGETEKLENIDIQVVDLEDNTLGRAVPGTIYIDVNAAGHGWFVDATPDDHSEFSYSSALTLIALPDSEAAGQIDLWSVILHEIGHILGHAHENEGVMQETLAPGTRKLSLFDESAQENASASLNQTDLYFTSLKEDLDLIGF